MAHTPVKVGAGLLPAFPDFSFEIKLWSSGLRYIAGVDEAGRGALAGPVAAAALVFPPDPSLITALQGVNDSKLMKPAERAAWAAPLREIAVTWGVGFASNQEIDRLGIVPATRLAAVRALEQLSYVPEHILVDYIDLPEAGIAYTSIIQGNRRSLSIAAASILAKTARDELLYALDDQYPGFGFAAHKGYGTAKHKSALESLGYSPVHRLSFHFKK